MVCFSISCLIDFSILLSDITAYELITPILADLMPDKLFMIGNSELITPILADLMPDKLFMNGDSGSDGGDDVPELTSDTSDVSDVDHELGVEHERLQEEL